MTTSKKTRTSLWTSVLSLVVCLSMLIGTTFAWFTDTASTGVNTITAGNLKVQLFYEDPHTEKIEVNKDTKLFLDANGNDMKWEPGALSYETFTVHNAGDLALKYRLTVNAVDATSYNNHTLKEALQVAVVKDGNFDGTRAAAEKLSYTPLDSFVVGGSDQTLAAKSEDQTFTVVIYWKPTENDNNFNVPTGADPLTIGLGVELVATQTTSEFDSISSTYDQDAGYTFAEGQTAEGTGTADANGNANVSANGYIGDTEKTLVSVQVSGQNEGDKVTLTATAITGNDTVNPSTVSVNSVGYELTLSDNAVVDEDHPAQVSIYVGEDAFNAGDEAVVVTHVKDNGDVETIKNGKFDASTGTVSFQLTSFCPVYVTPAAAKIESTNTKYATLGEAVEAAENGATVKLLRDASGGGVGLFAPSIEGKTHVKDLTIDFDGHTYTCTGPGVGSTNTENQVFHFEKDCSVTLKDGTLKVAADATGIKMGIQNYCNLTLDNFNVDTSAYPTIKYALSNNHGNVTIQGNSSITPASGKVAFDVYYWPSGGYADGVTVTVNTTGTINGNIEYGSDGTADGKANIATKAALIIQNGVINGSISTYNLASDNKANITITGGTFSTDQSALCGDGYATVYNSETGKYVYGEAAGKKVTSVSDLTSDNGTEFILTKDIEVSSALSLADNTTIDGNGHTITATGSNQTLYISGNNISLKNIVFKRTGDTWGITGGGVSYYGCTFADRIEPYICPSNDFTVEGCTFTNRTLQICILESNAEALKQNTNNLENLKITIKNNTFVVGPTTSENTASAHGIVVNLDSSAHDSFWENISQHLDISGNTFSCSTEGSQYIAYYFVNGGTALAADTMYTFSDNIFNGNAVYTLNSQNLKATNIVVTALTSN